MLSISVNDKYHINAEALFLSSFVFIVCW